MVASSVPLSPRSFSPPQIVTQWTTLGRVSSVLPHHSKDFYAGCDTARGAVTEDHFPSAWLRPSLWTPDWHHYSAVMYKKRGCIGVEGGCANRVLGAMRLGRISIELRLRFLLRLTVQVRQLFFNLIFLLNVLFSFFFFCLFSLSWGRQAAKLPGFRGTNFFVHRAIERLNLELGLLLFVFVFQWSFKIKVLPLLAGALLAVESCQIIARFTYSQAADIV